MYYQFTICEAAATYMPAAWLAYDVAFRRLMACPASGAAWGTIDSDLWQTRVTTGAKNPFCRACKCRHPISPCTVTARSSGVLNRRCRQFLHSLSVGYLGAPYGTLSSQQRRIPRVCLNFNRMRCHHPACIFLNACHYLSRRPPPGAVPLRAGCTPFLPVAPPCLCAVI